MASIARADVRKYDNFVNGQWVAASSGEMFPVYDPSTEEVIAHVASAGKSDVNAAVNAAREAIRGPCLSPGAQNFFVSPGFINTTRGSFPKTARKSASVDEPGKAP